MQDVENNMDELFRSAAENYKPNPGKSGWQVIQPQLVDHPVVSEAPVLKKKKNKTVLLLLLLPVAAAMFSYYFFFNTGKKSIESVNYSTQEDKTQKEHDALKPVTKTKQLDAESRTPQKNINHFQSVSKSFFTDEKSKDYLIQNTAKNNDNAEEKVAVSNYLNDEAFTSSPTKQDDEKVIGLQDTIDNTIQATGLKKSIATTKQKRFYLGLLSGPSLNQVKGQGFKKAGYNVGLIAGYKLNKNISIETGLTYSKKYYFSDGKYFNMEKMPATMELYSMTGSFNAVEIPLSVRYNLINGKTSSLFTSAGISSYVLTKENNEYNASLNGVQQNLKGRYKHVSANFASSVNLSAGYELSIGKQTSVRIQPYLQIPLKGLGVGKMQVMSSGINIAVTRPFH